VTTPLAGIVEERRAGSSIAQVTGEIDASNTEWIGARLRALLTNQSDGLVVDLSETSYLDSAGIALLFGLASELRLHQQRLYLVVADGSPIGRMARLTGLDTAVPTHATLDAALAQLDAGA
jgi:anti-sigma B factor antagonist